MSAIIALIGSGTLFLVQAGGTALIVRHNGYSTAYNYNQILPVVATVLGVLGSIAIGRYFTKKGRARGAAANAARAKPA